MSSRSLNQRIFRLSSGLVLFCALFILVTVWLSTLDHAKNQLNNNLNVAQSVIEQIVSGRESQLFISADVLTQDYGFKTAVGSQDKQTIDDVLNNHGERIEADLMGLLSLQGLVLNSTSDSLIVGDLFPDQNLVKQALQQGGASEIRVLNSRVYQVLILFVDIPGAPTLTVIGFEIDDALLERMKQISTLDATVSVLRDGLLVSSKSTLAKTPKVETNQNNISWTSLSLFAKNDLISRSFLLTNNADIQIWVTLSEKTERLFGDFYSLQIRVGVIALLSVILAILLGATVSKKLSKPILRLSKLAQSISAGDYQQEITVNTQISEIDDLTTSFRSMQNNIHERQEKIHYQASHDILTDLKNRYHIRDVIEKRIEKGDRFQVVGINILGFRGVNDTFGYQNGDKCLQIVAQRIKKISEESARLNGGEFLWLPNRIIDQSDMEDIQRQLEQPLLIEDVSIQLRMAIGFLEYPKHCDTSESILKHINICLDEARQSESLIVHYHDDFGKRYSRRLAIITELKNALENNRNEFSLVYQPKLNLKLSSVNHVEALIRWDNAILGFVPPDEFIGIAEHAGLIGKVTELVLQTVIKDAKTIKENNLDVCVAVNLSAKDILSPSLLDTIVSYLQQYDLPADCISFEITESGLMSDQKLAITELKRFRERGFRLAIDDFGTGYSSLAYLKKLPVSDLKIDKSFVLQLDKQQTDQQIVKTTLSLAHNMDLSVIAEGIENKASMMLLREWGCEYVQGYHICRPIPLNDFIRWYFDNQNTKWFEI